MITGLDHLVVLVNDITAGQAAYQTLLAGRGGRAAAHRAELAK